MDEKAYYFLILLAGLAIIFVFYLILRLAVSGGVKKSNRIIISLLYKIAEKRGVSYDELDQINTRIKELDDSVT